VPDSNQGKGRKTGVFRPSEGFNEVGIASGGGMRTDGFSREMLMLVNESKIFRCSILVLKVTSRPPDFKQPSYFIDLSLKNVRF